VREVLIRRTSHEHRGFRSLEMAFADGERIELGVEKNVKRHWTGPAPEIVAGYVQTRVSADRIVMRANVGPARSIEEARYRIGKVEREAPIMKWFGWGCLAAGLLLSGVEIHTVATKHGWNPLQWDGMRQLACVVVLVAFNTLGFVHWAVCRSLRGHFEGERQALMKALEEREQCRSVAYGGKDEVS